MTRKDNRVQAMERLLIALEAIASNEGVKTLPDAMEVLEFLKNGGFYLIKPVSATEENKRFPFDTLKTFHFAAQDYFDSNEFVDLRICLLFPEEDGKTSEVAKLLLSSVKSATYSPGCHTIFLNMETFFV